ncbi:MAG: PAS domain S-box protein, partial [Deltaproteobacteria bacterium]|nr:PAS domain S-box protein [Deltaproteobacteria bacterium]
VVEERRRAVSEERNYFVFPHALASGEERIVEVHSSPISFQERQVLFSIVHDITKRKKAEEEKNKLETQLQRAQKMEAIGALAGGIAHDFNNVLYAVMGYTELTMDLVTEGSTAQTNLQRVMKAADRAKEMVQQILAFSRQSKKEKKPISVQSVLKEAGNLLRTSIPSTIEIRQDIDTECDAVMADPTQIHQIIMNLATNAYHAMQETGGVL